MTLAILTTVFGWMAVLNIAMLLAATLGLMVMKKRAMEIHEGMFDMSSDALNTAYFTYLANYKILTLVFNVAPYLALKLSV